MKIINIGDCRCQQDEGKTTARKGIARLIVSVEDKGIVGDEGRKGAKQKNKCKHRKIHICQTPLP